MLKTNEEKFKIFEFKNRNFLNLMIILRVTDEIVQKKCFNWGL